MTTTADPIPDVWRTRSRVAALLIGLGLLLLGCAWQLHRTLQDKYLDERATAQLTRIVWETPVADPDEPSDGGPLILAGAGAGLLLAGVILVATTPPRGAR